MGWLALAAEVGIGLLVDGLALIRQDVSDLSARLAEVLLHGTLGAERGAFTLEVTASRDDSDGFRDQTLELLYLAACCLPFHVLSFTRSLKHGSCHAGGSGLEYESAHLSEAAAKARLAYQAQYVRAADPLALAAALGIVRPFGPMRFLQVLLACAAVLYLLYLTGLYFAQRSMSYPGARIRVSPEPAPARGLERSVLKTPLGDVETLFLPADASQAGKPQPAVVFGHGNGEVVDYWVSALDGFRDRGIGVLLVEYPGYGRSSGSTSEASIRAAMSAAYDHLASDPRVDRSRIVGFGQSLGGGAVCLLARDRPLRALILQSTFPSTAIFASRFLAPPFLLRDRFDNEAALRQFSGPVLVIHGRADTLIPWQQGRRLASASPHSTFRLYDCGHGCWNPDHLPFWRDVDSLLSEAGVR